MRRGLACVVALLALPSFVAAAENHFKKAYFGATRPGSFAKYKMTDEKGATSEYTYSRLEDQGEDRWIELRYEAVSGQFKGTNSITSCLLPASFALEQDAIDFMSHARRCAATSGTAKPTEYPAATMKAIASGSPDYASLVAFKGTETVAGKVCDRYSYSYKTNFMNTPATTTGDLWLNETVPFGVVKDSAKTQDASGKVLSTYDNVLVETGGNARSTLVGWSWAGKAAGRPGTGKPSGRRSKH